MPMYDYECSACGNLWELEQRMSEDPVKVCPACKKSAARRLLAAAPFHLKGSGWYATGYTKKNDPPPAETKPAEGPTCGAGACPACTVPATAN